MPKKEEITKNMLMGDIVREYPKAINVLLKQGINCIGCHIATWETLEQAATSHGVDVNNLLKKLNDTIK